MSTSVFILYSCNEVISWPLHPPDELCRVRGFSPDCSLTDTSYSRRSAHGLGRPAASSQRHSWLLNCCVSVRFYRKLRSGKNGTSDNDKTRSTKCLFPRASDRSRSWPDFLFSRMLFCVLFQEKHSVNVWKAEIKRLKGLCRGRSPEFPESEQLEFHSA